MKRTDRIKDGIKGGVKGRIKDGIKDGIKGGVKGRIGDRFFVVCIVSLAWFTVCMLLFVIGFVAREAIPLFRHVRIADFLTGSQWMPVDYVGKTSFGIFHFIAGTIAVSALSIVFSAFVSVGCALWLAFCASDRQRRYICAVIDILAGVPSVIYGFVGLLCVVRFFIRSGVSAGMCVLAAAIVLAAMLLPYLISSCTYSLVRQRELYLSGAQALGVSKWYVVTTMLIPSAAGHMLTAVMLAAGRAMGETMAVMMVIGNANRFPSLFGQGETIASLIALEMGTAEAGSDHYHALYAAGFVLMALVFLVHAAIRLIQRLCREK